MVTAGLGRRQSLEDLRQEYLEKRQEDRKASKDRRPSNASTATISSLSFPTVEDKENQNAWGNQNGEGGDAPLPKPQRKGRLAALLPRCVRAQD
jgi:hypothetical protein